MKRRVRELRGMYSTLMLKIVRLNELWLLLLRTYITRYHSLALKLFRTKLSHNITRFHKQYTLQLLINLNFDSLRYRQSIKHKST